MKHAIPSLVPLVPLVIGWLSKCKFFFLSLLCSFSRPLSEWKWVMMVDANYSLTDAFDDDACVYVVGS